MRRLNPLGAMALPFRRPERRRHARRTGSSSPVTMITVSPQLVGETVNVSDGSFLLTARGEMQLLVEFEGRRYKGRLVRAYPTEEGTTAYAVELDEIFPDAHDTPHSPF